MSAVKGMLWSLAVVLFAGSANTDSNPVDEFFVRVRVVEQCDVEERDIVDCSVLTKDQEWSFFSGGEVASSEDVPPLQFGTRINGHIPISEGETQSVALRIEFSVLHNPDKNSIPVVRGNLLDLRADLILGETTRISCGGNLTCVLRLGRRE